MIQIDQLAGQQIAGRFDLEECIGRGATGVVYRARDGQERWVAVKLLAPTGEQSGSTARYLRGTRLASQLQHPNIVRVFDSGRWGPRRGYYFMSMELVEGVPLSMVRYAKLGPGASVALIRQILEAAVYVHARGTLHRDLKPDNVMVSRDRDGNMHCRVTDFGIASNRMLDATLTQQGAVIGTPAYMAPEQAQGLPSIGPSVDLYAIGVMLYELLSGRLPFTGGVQSLLYRKVQEEPPVIPNVHELDAGLVDLVMRLIARQPQDRYSHARDVLDDLAAHVGTSQISRETWLTLQGTESVSLSNVDDSAIRPTVMESLSDQVTALPDGPTDISGTWSPDDQVSRLWGRDELIADLDVYAARTESGLGQVVLLSGGLGMGKTAILDEVAIRVQEQGRFQVIRARFSTASPSLGGLRAAVEQHLGLRGRSMTTVRVLVGEHLRRMGVDDSAEAEELIRWLRPNSPGGERVPEMRGLDFSPGLRYLRRLANHRPVLLMMDDLHHGGGDAAALIEYLVFELGFDPCDLWVLGSMVQGEIGSEFSEALSRSNHAEGRNRHLVSIPPLSNPVIVRGLRQELGVSAAQAEAFAQRACGSPLIARGLASAANEDDAMWQTQSVSSAQQPAIQRVLETMLHRLLQTLLSKADDAVRLRAMLEAIALLGPSIEVSALAGFLNVSAVDSDFEDDLDLLIEREVLVEANPDGQDWVSLKPDILAKVILNGLRPRKRRRMHQRAIEILGEMDGIDPGVLGDHYFHLGDSKAAVEAWKKGETHALMAGAPYAAVDWGQKIRAELPEPERSTWSVRMGRVLLDAGDPRRAEHILKAAMECPEVDVVLLASDVLCDVYENLGKGMEWTALAGEVRDRMSQASRAGQHAGYCALAMWETSHGNDQSGCDAARQALAISTTNVERRRAAQRLAFSSLPSLALEQAGAAAEQALEAAGEHPQLRARSLRTLGVVRMWQHRYEEAVALHEQALALARWKGLSSRAALSLQDMGDSLRVAGRWDAAIDRYSACIQAAEALDLGSTVYLARFKSIMCHIALNTEIDTRDQIRRLTDPAVKAGLGLAIPFSNLLLAWSFVRLGDREQAQQAVNEASILQQFRVDPQVPEIFEEIHRFLAS